MGVKIRKRDVFMKGRDGGGGGGKVRKMDVSMKESDEGIGEVGQNQKKRCPYF